MEFQTSLQKRWDELKANAERGANAGGLSWVRTSRAQAEPSGITGFWLNMILELKPSGMVIASFKGSRGPWHNTGIMDNWDMLKVRAERF